MYNVIMYMYILLHPYPSAGVRYIYILVGQLVFVTWVVLHPYATLATGSFLPYIQLALSGATSPRRKYYYTSVMLIYYYYYYIYIHYGAVAGWWFPLFPPDGMEGT